MRRREFIGLASGAVAWPLTARAQQGDRLVGLISGFAEADFKPLVAEFRSQMERLGWRDGDKIKIVAKATGGNYPQLDAEAKNLVALNASVIVAMGTPGLSAVLKHSQQTPVVFTLVADPVGQGLIDSLSHPGRSATGLTNFEFSIAGKWLDILRDIDPSISNVSLITNPANPNTKQFVEAFITGGKAHNLTIHPETVRNASEIERAIRAAGQRIRGSLAIMPDSLPVVNKDIIISEALRQKLPAIYPFRIFPANGGLLSYGLEYRDIYRQAASYSDKILRGTPPGEIPVEAPNKFELVLNLKTANALGLSIPQTLQVSADEVIE
jgi:ABC-type uncharacterized transport system substrate-binding protein